MIDIHTYSEGVFAKQDAEGYEALDEKEKIFADVWGTSMAIKQSGFSRFYSSAAGDRAARIPDAFRTIGAFKSAEIIEKANAIFGTEGPSTDENERYAQINQLSEDAVVSLDGLKNRFAMAGDNVLFLLMAYLEE